MSEAAGPSKGRSGAGSGRPAGGSAGPPGGRSQGAAGGKSGGAKGPGGTGAPSSGGGGGRSRHRGGRRRGAPGGRPPGGQSGAGNRPPGASKGSGQTPTPGPGSIKATTTAEAADQGPPPIVDRRDPSKSARRRAVTIAAVPAALVLVVVGGVVVLATSLITGLVVGGIVGLAWWIVTLLGGRRVLLRALGAEVPEDATVARAENLVDGLCATMGLVVPEILVVDDPSRNAMALGWRPGDAVLVITSGLLSSLGPVSLEGVLAHELAHIKRGDIAPATVAAAVLLPVAAITPAAGSLVHRWAGIGREFRADTVAVGVTRFPPGLRDALATMIEGPAPAPGSPLADSAAARATRWLWAVALDPATTGTGASEAGPVTGKLDAPVVRIAALDEY